MESIKNTNDGVNKKKFDQSLQLIHEQTRKIEQKLTLKIEENILEKENDCQDKVSEIKKYIKTIKGYQRTSWQFRFPIQKEKHNNLTQTL